MLKLPNWLLGMPLRVAGRILVAIGIFLLGAATPAFVIGVYDKYVLGQNGSPQLKTFLILSESLILVLGAVLSVAYLLSRLSDERTLHRE